MLTAMQRIRMQRTISAVIGLELWLTGELDLDNAELLDLFSSLQARMSVVQAIAWPSELEDDSELVEDDSAGVE